MPKESLEALETTPVIGALFEQLDCARQGKLEETMRIRNERKGYGGIIRDAFDAVVGYAHHMSKHPYGSVAEDRFEKTIADYIMDIQNNTLPSQQQ